jgi:oligopeptide/dipeptide ABC transporter ATP-binding protein
MDEPTPLLHVEGIETRFETKAGVVCAVNGVSLAVEEGELVGLVGETGCGKSVSVRSIIGLVRKPGKVTAGKAIFQGEDLLAMPAAKLQRIRGDGIGFVPQNPFAALNPVLRLERQFENVIRAHRDISRDEAHTMAEQILSRLAIPAPTRVLRGHAHELSGGMAQRVVIGLALVLNPALMIADEPTTGLDATVQRQLLDLVAHLLEHDRRAMLLVTHDLGIVAQYCHRVVVMYAGKVVETGPVRDVFRAPAHPYTRALLDAVPRAGAALTTLSGTIPSLIDYPQGCPFRDRCSFAFDRCAAETPEVRPLGERREVSCHLPHGVSATLANAEASAQA